MRSFLIRNTNKYSKTGDAMLWKKYVEAMNINSNWPILIFIWFLFGEAKVDGWLWWVITITLLLWPIKEEATKKGALNVFIGTILFYEELILSPLKKFVFPGVGWVIRKSPPWAIITIFCVLETLKITAKPLLFVAIANGIIPALVFLVAYIVVSFFSLQIMVHGSEKLRSYWWFNQIYEWVAKTFGPYKKKLREWISNLGIVLYINEMKKKAKEEGDSIIGQIWNDARKQADKYREKSQD